MALRNKTNVHMDTNDIFQYVLTISAAECYIKEEDHYVRGFVLFIHTIGRVHSVLQQCQRHSCPLVIIHSGQFSQRW